MTTIISRILIRMIIFVLVGATGAFMVTGHTSTLPQYSVTLFIFLIMNVLFETWRYNKHTPTGKMTRLNKE